MTLLSDASITVEKDNTYLQDKEKNTLQSILYNRYYMYIRAIYIKGEIVLHKVRPPSLSPYQPTHHCSLDY